MIEGRKPNYFISAKIAGITNQKAAYTRNKGFDKTYYLDLIEKAIKEHGSITRHDVNGLILDKLPDWMNDKQRAYKITNLLAELRRNEIIKNDGIRSNPKWTLVD